MDEGSSDEGGFSAREQHDAPMTAAAALDV